MGSRSPIGPILAEPREDLLHRSDGKPTGQTDRVRFEEPAPGRSLFNGANADANSGRRNSLATRVQNAANHVCSGGHASAIALLDGVLEKIVDFEQAPGWMYPSVQKSAPRETVQLLLSITQLLE